MRYIKHINEYNNTNEYYKLMTNPILSLDSLNFTDSEIRAIKNILGKGYFLEMNGTFVSYSVKNSVNISILNVKKEYIMDINKYPDEWYIAAILNLSTYHYYKCDQLEGLLKLIQDKL